MPHEVIMPALGMAQDTGLIVAWLKDEGAAVKAGDPIMEVETDKATMEVEASHDGYLTGIRAAAGDNVPVGKVVAVISDSAEKAETTAEGAASDGTSGDTRDAQAATPVSDAPMQGREVIMPALGMAQDSGTIVAWLRAPGDKVAATDPLLEVETDKATMEVEAGHDGWIAELRGHAGDAVPVGEVIALISRDEPAEARHVAIGETKGSATAGAAAGTASRGEDRKIDAADAADTEGGAPAPSSRPAAAPSPARKPAQPPAPGTPVGRVLASPKARRLAAERGLDLARLVAAGHPQPYHAADIEVLAALPSAAPAVTTSALPVRLTAQVPAVGFDAFRDWLGGVMETPASATECLALAAVSALRTATGTQEPLTVALGAASLTDPDLTGLSALDRGERVPDLALHDLTATRVSGFDPGAAEPPALVVTRRDATLELTLTHAPGALPPDAAIALIAGLAERLDDPLRLLL